LVLVREDPIPLPASPLKGEERVGADAKGAEKSCTG
jgi:hypothetical protein